MFLSAMFLSVAKAVSELGFHGVPNLLRGS
ncbi:hypothetical protein X758_20270 [Mesorhizobium sp. LSHC416B00]|nr:hypothetical protein X761_15460 [Mesorhizobium sp. LSHC424B00]ESX69149.1 hypothetical protein X758_20270 [Mesorhizobium sp. LSHC416B00]